MTLGPQAPPLSYQSMVASLVAPLNSEILAATLMAGGAQPDFQHQSTMQTDAFKNGINAALPMCHNISQVYEGYSRFTDAQCSMLCRFCYVLKPLDLPLIWHAIDKTKTTMETRRVLNREWDKLKVDVNIQVYNIWFNNNLCDAVRKQELVTMGEATFLV